MFSASERVLYGKRQLIEVCLLYTSVCKVIHKSVILESDKKL